MHDAARMGEGHRLADFLKMRSSVRQMRRPFENRIQALPANQRQRA